MDTPTPFEPTMEQCIDRARDRSNVLWSPVVVVCFPDSDSLGVISQDTFFRNLAPQGFKVVKRFDKGKETDLTQIPEGLRL